MVDSIQGVNQGYGMGFNPQAQTLTSDQKTQIQSILSKYDSSSLTAADAKSIFRAFRDAGIRPSKDLQETIRADGFDPQQLRSLAGPQGYHGHHGHHNGGETSSTSSSNSGINMSTLQSLQSILSQYDLNDMNQDQQNDLLTNLTNSGLMKGGNIIDLSA